MITINNVTNENDYEIMCCIESRICKENKALSWQVHIGGLSFDRYMFGNGAVDLYSYGKLIYLDEIPIGYLLAFAYEGEFVLRIINDYEEYIDEAIKLTEALYQNCKELFVIANSLDNSLCKALVNHGYRKEDEKRFQAALNLKNWMAKEYEWISERINILTEVDIPERVKYAAIPTGENISEKMYRDYMQSNEYKNTLDYIIRDTSTNDFIGYVTWWIDEESKTALLEPVACCEKYRGLGIMKHTLNFGLRELQMRGMEYVYVSTSIGNKAAKALYQSVGFVKTGEANKYVKCK